MAKKKSAVKKPKMDPKMKHKEMQEENMKGVGIYKKGGSVKRKSC